MYDSVQAILAQIKSRGPKEAPWEMTDSWMLHPSQGFIRLGGHQLVQAGVAGEAVLEGDDVPGAADEAASRRHISFSGEETLEKESSLGIRDRAEPLSHSTPSCPISST